ncbi:hypothetical protein CTEN210_06919 [Chaetoceros tenuissimus]|uniref:Uncharacterized protein n=1 Tax=Chaetoceros tenuissimus TaxID=426638 RepID=A0AAD3CRA3_9STRA|nr:hypothetical protein CTEN210_06919 [Chaetoceros tenuissimus]
MIHRSVFYEVVTAITSRDFKQTTCANYITHILVDETIERLQMFFDKIFVSNTSPQYKQLSNKLTTVRDFLKIRLRLHMLREDSIGFHSLGHALNKPSLTLTHGANGKCRKLNTCVVCSNTDQTMKFNPVSCNGCKFPFHLLSQIDNLLEETKCSSVDYCKRNLTQQDFDDGGALVGNARNQFEAFIRATARKMNQRNAIKELKKMMKLSCEVIQDDCPIAKKTCDWTDREIEYSSRESQIDYFGKRGMSLQFDATETYVWDKTLQKAVEKTIYFDQVMEGSNKQDVSVVFSFLEALLVHTMDVLPKVKEIIFQSDNAMCYQNTALVTAVALLNAKLKGDIFVRQLIFTETMDGKGPSDVRGAEQKNRLSRGIKKTDRQNRIVRIKTAGNLASALIYKGGTKNGVIQLLEVDFQRMDELLKFIEPTTKEIKKFVTRKNEIQFKPPTTKIT